MGCLEKITTILACFKYEETHLKCKNTGNLHARGARHRDAEKEVGNRWFIPELLDSTAPPPLEEPLKYFKCENVWRPENKGAVGCARNLQPALLIASHGYPKTMMSLVKRLS